jgi:archaellin
LSIPHSIYRVNLSLDCRALTAAYPLQFSASIGYYEMVKVEVRTPKGAALTVVRTAPGGMPANSFIDLG